MNYLKLEIFHNLSGKGNYFQRSYLYCFHSTKFLFVLKGTIISEERRHLPVKWVLFYQPHPQLLFRYNFFRGKCIASSYTQIFWQNSYTRNGKKIQENLCCWLYCHLKSFNNSRSFEIWNYHFILIEQISVFSKIVLFVSKGLISLKIFPFATIFSLIFFMYPHLFLRILHNFLFFSVGILKHLILNLLLLYFIR